MFHDIIFSSLELFHNLGVNSSSLLGSSETSFDSNRFLKYLIIQAMEGRLLPFILNLRARQAALLLCCRGDGRYGVGTTRRPDNGSCSKGGAWILCVS